MIFGLSFSFILVFLSSSVCHSFNENSKVLLFSFDGFRHDYFELAEKAKIDLTNFKTIFKLGVKAAHLNNVFITRTFPNHMSLITGCYEETHGIIDNSFYDPFFNETFSNQNLTQLLESKWFSNSEPLWVTNQLNNHSSGVIYWPGQQAPYKNQIYPTFSMGLFDGKLPFEYKIDVALNWLSRGETTLGLIYHPEPDGIGHKFGPNSQELLTKLQELDRNLGYLLNEIRTRGLEDHLNVVIVSDHGMTNISNDRRVVMDSYIDPELYREHGEESYAMWGMWPSIGINESSILTELRKVPHVTVFAKRDIPVDWHYSNNRRVAPIVVLADVGWSLVHNETDEVTGRGMHGYASESNDMQGIFVAWGPNIVASNRSNVVVRAVDVFPLVAAILGWSHVPPVNGSLANVRWIVRNSGIVNEAGIFTSLVIICVLSLITVLSACIVVSCAHYNANALRVQKIGNTYVLKSGNLVRKWQQRQDSLTGEKNPAISKHKKFLKKKSKITEADSAFLLESNDEDEILGDIASSNYKFHS